LPYAWDVRMGHKQREAALDELDDDIDVDYVHKVLAEIGYDGDLGESTGKRLIAYYVADQELPAEQLAQLVQDQLPAFMMPTRFMRVDEIPLSENGKVDHEALPDPNQSKTSATGQFVAPQDETEERLAQVWAHVLGLDKVSVRDNFFELGGDSILAIRIVARCQHEGIKITPLQFFESLTVEKLASRWAQDGRQTATPRQADTSAGSTTRTALKTGSDSESAFSMAGLKKDALKSLSAIMSKANSGDSS